MLRYTNINIRIDFIAKILFQNIFSKNVSISETENDWSPFYYI